MGELADYAKRNSPFLQLEDGETVEAEFVGFKIGVNQFNPEKEIVVYQLRVANAMGETRTVSFKTASGKVARFFDEISKGTHVRISRDGTGNDTTYELERVDA